MFPTFSIVSVGRVIPTHTAASRRRFEQSSAALSLLNGEVIECWHCVSFEHALPLSEVICAQAHVEFRACINAGTRASVLERSGWSADSMPMSGELPCGGQFSTFALRCSSARESCALKRIVSAVNGVAHRARSAIACDELSAFVRRERTRTARLRIRRIAYTH